MNFLITYFTGTGVTAKFASDIAAGLKESKHEVTLLRLKKGTKIDVENYDVIGFGAPAYSYRAPRLATRIIRKQNLHEKPFFVFCTNGGGPGNTLWNLYNAARRTGSVCLGFTEGVGITNLRSWMPLKKKFSGELKGLSQYDVQTAKTFGKTITERIDSINNSERKLQTKDWRPKGNIFWMFWSIFFTWGWQMMLMLGMKFVDKSKCSRCQSCATKICPSGAIKMKKNNTPMFVESRCVGCNGCVNLCPEDAIWTLRSKAHVQYDKYKDFILKEK